MDFKEIHFETLGSTHGFAVKNGSKLPHLTVITTDFQTEGRGRHGRSWLAARGSSVLLSIILRPEIGPEQAPLISPVTAVAATRALRGFGISPGVKWPNDVLSGKTKIAGLIAEAVLGEKGLDFIVASIGINVTQSREELAGIDRPATSLFIETGRTLDPNEVKRAFLREFAGRYEAFISEGFSAIYEEWKNALSDAGQHVSLDLGGEVVRGKIAGFGRDASLILEMDGGQRRSFTSGEIVRVWPPEERN